MNESERTVHEFLLSLEVGPVVYEPDGKNPPDFLVAGQIAVEVRRLNQNVVVGDRHRGIEEASVPLRRAVEAALAESGPPHDGRSWFVHYTVRRPLPTWKAIEASLREAVLQFKTALPNPPTRLRLIRPIELSFFQASQAHESLLLLGGYSDYDAGGFLIAELARNLRVCIDEKVKKVARVRSKYPEWWLAFEDRIGYGNLDDSEVAELRNILGPVPEFSKVYLVNPLHPTSATEVGATIQPAV